MIVFYCSKRSPANNAWWACSRAKGHPGGCVFDRKDKSRKEKVMIDTKKLPKKDYRALYKDMHEKNKTLALALFDVEDENKKLKNEIERRKEWIENAKQEAGFERNVSFDTVWASVLKAYRNGGAGWTPFKVCKPEEQRGPGKGSGWSAWLECTNGDMTDDGFMVFTAAYSHELRRWQDPNGQVRGVTHYRKLPTLDSIK